ncbi:rhodanese-like domain-containing protein [Winogradskyella sp. A2]|uniref:rhodanese-like domain-containing protein n=1 Tax=Winogradskyella sp. A2 TaxID=3366944 RepID=UPI00398C331F
MKLFVILSLITSLIACNGSQNDTVKVLTTKEFKEQVDNKQVQLIDVRTPKEFISGHIKGARNIDFNSNSFDEEFNKLNKDEPVYIYCRSGVRSGEASKKLETMGFKEIYDLKGGIINYK